MANLTSPMKTEDRASGGMQSGKAPVRDAATHAADRVKDAASSTMKTITDAATHAADRAKDACSTVADSAEHATSSVGGSLQSLGHQVREHGPHGGTMGDASSAVAKGLESTGRYLQEEGLSGMADDLTNVIKRNPIPAMLIGVGIGFLLARAMHSGN